MECRIHVEAIEDVSGAVGLVCEILGADVGSPSPPPHHAVYVDSSLLAKLLPTIDPAIDTLVFLAPGAAVETNLEARARIVALVDALRAAPHHVAAIRRVPAINAAKRVHDGVVVEAIDRETLNLLRSPEVVERGALEAALGRVGPLGPASGDDAVNPTVLMASAGGKVLVVDTFPD